MPTIQYTALANLTLSSTATTVTFSSINGTYRDLFLVMSVKAGGAGVENPIFNFNGVGTTTYNYVTLQGNGTTARSGVSYNDSSLWSTDSYNMVNTTQFDTLQAHFMDYAQIDKQKTILIRAGSPNATNGGVTLTGGRWANTAAITSISIATAYGGGYATGSSFALYGVK